MADSKTDDLADLISRITPETANSVESGRKAANWAAKAVLSEMPAIKASVKGTVWPETPEVIRSVIAGKVFNRARLLRDGWLREHNAFAENNGGSIVQGQP